MASSDHNLEVLVKSILPQLKRGPKDVDLHIRILDVCFQYTLIEYAYNHIFDLEFIWKPFINNYGWYESLNELFKSDCHNTKDWLFQLLLLTVKERMCMLSISDKPRVEETRTLLHAYDQAIRVVTRTGPSPGNDKFYAALIQHHRAQITFHAALLLLKNAKTDQICWDSATKFATPLMLIAWQDVPQGLFDDWSASDTNVWEMQRTASIRWNSERCFRYTQAGNYLLENSQLKNQTSLKGFQCFSDIHWREMLYKALFTNKIMGHIKTYYLFNAFDALKAPGLRFPQKEKVQIYDYQALTEYRQSLHNVVWLMMTYENYAHFELNWIYCGLVEHYGLNKLDFYAFLYCAALTARQKKPTELTDSERPILVPAHITDLLCSQAQIEWWDYVHEYHERKGASDWKEDRELIIRGRDVVRCIGEHGLDPELLCTLGRIFSDRSKLTSNNYEKKPLEKRAALYYSTAILLLEKLKRKMPVERPRNRLFDYTHKNLSTKELDGLLEECKLFVADNNVNDGEDDKDNKSPQSSCQHQAYKKIGTKDNNSSSDVESKSKFAGFLCRARSFSRKYTMKAGDIAEYIRLKSNVYETTAAGLGSQRQFQAVCGLGPH